MNEFISYNEKGFVCLFPLLVCSVWNYVKRHFIGNKEFLV